VPRSSAAACVRDTSDAYRDGPLAREGTLAFAADQLVARECPFGAGAIPHCSGTACSLYTGGVADEADVVYNGGCGPNGRHWGGRRRMATARYEAAEAVHEIHCSRTSSSRSNWRGPARGIAPYLKVTAADPLRFAALTALASSLPCPLSALRPCPAPHNSALPWQTPCLCPSQAVITAPPCFGLFVASLRPLCTHNTDPVTPPPQ